MSQIPANTAEVTPQQKSALLILFVTFFVDILGFGLVLTLSPYYVQQYPYLFGIKVPPGIAVGALTACYPILQLFFAPIWGRVSDRIGRRPIILMSLLGNSLAWLFFGFARSLEMLFLARMLSGILSSASLPTVQAYIADSTPPAKRSVWIGIVVGMGFGFGFMLGPPIGGILGTNPWPDWMNSIVVLLPGGHSLLSSNHLSCPAFLAALIAFCNFLVATRRLPESLLPELRRQAASRPHQSHLSQFRSVLSDPTLLTLLIVLGLATFAMQAMEQNITLFGNREVTTLTAVHWSQLTPAYIQGRAVIEVQYAPDMSQSAKNWRAHWSVGQPAPLLRMNSILKPGTVLVRRHLVQEDTGIVLFVAAFIVGMIQGGALKKLAPRFGDVRLVVAGCFIGAVGFFLLPWAIDFWSLMAAVGVVSVGLSFISPCLRGLISGETAAHSQGATMGVAESVRGLAMATGPLIGGWLFDRGPGFPFIMGAISLCICFLLALRLRSPEVIAIAETGVGVDV